MRLPDTEDVNRFIPQANTRLVNTDTGSLGGTLKDVGARLDAVGDERDRLQVSKARARFLTRKAEIDGGYDQDREFETLAGRYEEGIRESLSEAAELITNPEARALFVESLQPTVQTGIERARDHAFGVEGDIERAQAVTDLNDLALAGGDPDELSVTAIERLNRMVEAGFADAEWAAKQELSWRQTFAEERIANMPPEKRFEALKQPWAQSLTPAARMRLEEQAKIDANESFAVQFVDEQVMSGASDAGIDKAIRGIKDKDQRAYAERRWAYERTRRTDRENEYSEAIYERYGDQVRFEGLRVADIPERERRAMTQAQLNNLMNVEASILSGKGDVTTDRDVQKNFYELIAGGEYSAARKLVNDNFDRISRADRDKFLSRAAKPEDGFKIESDRTVTQLIKQEMARAGMREKDVDKAFSEVFGQYEDKLIDYQQRNELEPDDKWRTDTVKELVRQTRLTEDQWGLWNADRTLRGYEIKQRLEDGDIQIPEHHLKLIVNRGGEPLKRKDLPDVYAAVAEQARARFAARGYYDPTPEGMDAMITDILSRDE